MPKEKALFEILFGSPQTENRSCSGSLSLQRDGGRICKLRLTCFRAAALLGAAGTPDVTAAGVRATLAPTDPKEEEEEEETQHDHDNKDPVWEKRRRGEERPF